MLTWFSDELQFQKVKDGNKQHAMATSTSMPVVQKAPDALAGKKRKKKTKPENKLVGGKAPASSCQEKVPATVLSRNTGI